MVLWRGGLPRFFCYQLEFCQILLTGERSYQWLKDAILFGLLSDKSAEIREGKFKKLPILHTDRMALCLFSYANEAVMSLLPQCRPGSQFL